MKQVVQRILPGCVFSIAIAMLVLIIAPWNAHSQPAFEYKWMAVGSLHNWYGNTGCEIEEGRIKEQQDGLQWPAIYRNEDCQAAKALWIGVTNYTDNLGKSHDFRVVHVGPRVPGTNEFIPVSLEMTSRFDAPLTYVDGALSVGKDIEINKVDPTIKPDRMLVNVTNTAIGIQMKRTIMQWSQQYHDNYHIQDYVFTNTNATQTLTGVYFYFLYRYAVNKEGGYFVANSSRWGINEMLGTRGDGVKNDLDDAVDIPGVYTSPHMRIQYAYMGKHPTFTAYDNIGAPIWSLSYAYDTSILDKADTVGRISAPTFVGVVTLHADKSATDQTDDPSQPSTTSWEGSDEGNTSNNDMFNDAKCQLEYGWIERGHKNPRHMDQVQQDGKFDEPTNDPALGTPGGFQNANGYGPYTLAPGQSIHIVMAEAAAGLSREKCISVGQRYKNKEIDAKAKNDSVLTGKDSLFQTFRRAIANFKSGYSIPQAPLPPSTFNVNSGGDKVSLTWDVYNASDPNIKGFRIYRSSGRYDINDSLIYEAGPSERSYNDVNVIRGVANYYYIVTVGDPALNTGAGLTPPGPLLSSRYYSQVYLPAFLKRQAGHDGNTEAMDLIRIVPNPYSISSDPSRLRFDREPDKIAFFNIPGYCTIKIYTELGELINTIEHSDGSGDAYWNSLTSSDQVIVSGIYLVVIENKHTGERIIKKLAVIR